MRLMAEWRRSPATRASPLVRSPFLTLLVITLMCVSALTACETDNDANTPTAIPAAMATPASTVSLDGSTDSNSTTPPTQAVVLSAPSSGSEELFIIAQESELIELDLNAGDTLTVSYVGSGGVTSNRDIPFLLPVEFLILDPANEPLLEVGALEENSVEVQVAITGTHQLVFTNPARLRALAVLVDYATNPRAAALTAPATPTPTVSLDGSTDSNSTTPPTQAVVLSAPSSGSEELFIIAQESELIELDLNAGDTLTVSYVGSGGVTSNRDIPFLLPVEFLILDPANEPLLEVGALEENSVEVQVAITGTHQLVFTNPARLQALAVLVDYATNPRAAAPTVTPTPTPTVSLDGSTDSNSTTPSTQAASLSIPSSGSEDLYIISQDSELIELDLNAGDTLKVSYCAVGATTGGYAPGNIEFVILGPLDELLLEVEALEDNYVAVQVKATGTHQLVFTNPARLQGHEVSVEYAINP